ncbi:hypothetical protein AAKU64_004602 [Undibacterium sp. GrIS 1.8]|uniref:hypothetical protein n=2 Tax=unclassified Undibacterium TaxID=2630295 RepID=UPI0033938731
MDNLMYVNVAVLKETQVHERRVALIPSVAGVGALQTALVHLKVEVKSTPTPIIYAGTF